MHNHFFVYHGKTLYTLYLFCFVGLFFMIIIIIIILFATTCKRMCVCAYCTSALASNLKHTFTISQSVLSNAQDGAICRPYFPETLWKVSMTILWAITYQWRYLIWTSWFLSVCWVNYSFFILRKCAWSQDLWAYTSIKFWVGCIHFFVKF